MTAGNVHKEIRGIHFIKNALLLKIESAETAELFLEIQIDYVGLRMSTDQADQPWKLGNYFP